MKKYLTTYLVFLFALTVWATLFFIVPDYLDRTVSNFGSFITLAIYAVALGIVPFLLFTVLCAEKHVAAVMLPLYAVLGSTVAYYSYAYHMLLTAHIVDATLHTNIQEASGVISWPLIAFVLFNLLIAVLFAVWRWRIGNFKWSYWGALIGLVTLPLYGHLMGSTLVLHYPTNIWAAMSEYCHLNEQRKQSYELLPAERTAAVNTDSLQVVIVIGEAARADHLSLYGYERPTTPRLQQRKGVIPLPHVYSPYTYTLGSVPYILTPADSLHPDWANNKESLIPYYRQRGFATYWLSNSDIGDTYIHFMHSADTLIFVPVVKQSKNVDEELLPLFRNALARTDTTTGQGLYILHSIGSHWYYDTYLPDDFAPFKPGLSNRIITRNTPEQVINSYDNTIAYMDMFVDSLCGMLEERPAILFYQSDHGESLGENGHWLHASDAEEPHYPAAFMWCSPLFRQKYPDLVARLEDLSDQQLTTAYFFPTLLSIIGLRVDLMIDQRQ